MGVRTCVMFQAVRDRQAAIAALLGASRFRLSLLCFVIQRRNVRLLLKPGR